MGDSVTYLIGGACVYVEMGEGRSVNWGVGSTELGRSVNRVGPRVSG